jgi:protein-disulfide isomerase
MRVGFFRALPLTLICGLISWSCVSTSKAPNASNQVVATVNGQPITEQDLEPAIRSQLQQIRTQEYQIKSEALEKLIRARILEAEAKKRGVTVDKLLDQDVSALVTEPEEAQVRATYDQQRNLFGTKSYDEVRDQIRQALRRAQTQDAQQTYAEMLRSRANVSVLLSPPKIEVAVDPTRVRGNPNAPVTIVEFSDFECPYCKAAQPTLKHLLEKYSGQVKLAYRDLPIRGSHPHADSAAEAARCAGDQGKFWEYHDILFEDQRKLDDDSLKSHAKTLGLDPTKFDQCVSSGKFRAKVQEDYDQAFKVGVTGTPGFFVNGILLNGAQPSSAFEKVIDSQLKMASLPSPAKP